MKKLIVAGFASIAISTTPVTETLAENSSAFVALTSNYVFRGQTQTKDGAAVQGGYEIKESKGDTGWYAGTFASTVSNGIELNLFGGWEGEFGKAMGYDLGAIHYKYTDSGFAADATEIYAGVNYETAYAKLYMGTGNTKTSYLDLGASFIVLTDVDLDLHFGHLSLGGTNDVSAALSIETKGYDLSLGLTHEDSGINGTEFFVTVGKEFEL